MLLVKTILCLIKRPVKCLRFLPRRPSKAPVCLHRLVTTPPILLLTTRVARPEQGPEKSHLLPPQQYRPGSPLSTFRQVTTSHVRPAMCLRLPTVLDETRLAKSLLVVCLFKAVYTLLNTRLPAATRCLLGRHYVVFKVSLWGMTAIPTKGPVQCRN